MPKNGFLTFILAMVPGMGQMYYGYMRRGLSLMLSFVACIAISTFFGLFALVLPVIWAYCFFDTFRLRTALGNGTAEPDAYLFGQDGSNLSFSGVLARRHLLYGWILVVLGAGLLLDRFVVDPLKAYSYNCGLIWLNGLLNRLPTLVVAALLIILGICLVRGRRPQNPELPAANMNEEDAHHE